MNKTNQQIKEPDYVAQTLAWCNLMRAKYTGKRPLERLPKGIKGDPWSCPCGTASGLVVFSSAARVTAPHEDYKNTPLEKYESLPQAVRQFVDVFDNGDLPQYEAGVCAP